MLPVFLQVPVNLIPRAFQHHSNGIAWSFKLIAMSSIGLRSRVQTRVNHLRWQFSPLLTSLGRANVQVRNGHVCVAIQPNNCAPGFVPSYASSDASDIVQIEVINRKAIVVSNSACSLEIDSCGCIAVEGAEGQASAEERCDSARRVSQDICEVGDGVCMTAQRLQRLRTLVHRSDA